MVKGVIFDVDGTILDSMEIWRSAGPRFLADHGIEAGEGLDEILFCMSMEEGASYMKRTYGLDVSEEEISEGILATVRDFYYEEAPLKEGAGDLIRGLYERGIPMTIATSSIRDHIERALERNGVYHMFRKMITCSEAGAGKKDPLIFHMASELMGSSPSETMVIEDGLYAIRTAKAAGFITAGVYDDASPDDQEEIERISDIYLPDMKDHVKILEYADRIS